MQIDILSLFPEYFRGPFDESMIARARRQGLLDLRLIDLRQYGTGSYRQVDDRAYGGGPGMVLMSGPVSQALREVKELTESEKQKTVFLSPQGKPLTASKCRELAQVEHLILLCGHYEGIDQRVLDREVDEEISIGDYVLTNGCLPAIVLVDAVARFIPGVIGHADAAAEDSFENDLLDCPHYTRPEVFEGVEVPQVLLQGNHAAISDWRREQAIAKTKRVRPDLFHKYLTRCTEELPESQDQRQQTGWSLKRMVLMVQDLKRSRRFYRDLLGLKTIQESESMLVYGIGSLELALVAGSLQATGTVLEVVIDDPKQLGQIAQRVQVGGLGSVDGSVKAQRVWFIDPDGNQWLFTGSQVNN